MSKTPKKLVTLIEGRRAGLLLQNPHGRLEFAYDDDYAADPATTPLSLSLPKTGGQFSHDAIAPVVYGLLPDNEDVLDRWGRMFGVRAGNPFALLAHVGADCAGAVQLVPEDRVADLDIADLVELTDDDVETMLRELRSDPYTWQQPTGARGGHFSLAGAQSKFALHRTADGQWARPVGRRPTTHIFKPAMTGIDNHDINEHLCLRAAAGIGLAAARSDIVEFGDQRAVVVERFDRRQNDEGVLERVHQEDMCQALGAPPSRKYQRDGGPTPTQIVELIRNVTRGSAEADVERFVRALVFNWVIGGTDAHAKNYGMLLRGPNSRLTPLYDVATAVVLDEWNPHKWEMAMHIDKKGKFKYITRGDWERFARNLRVPFDLVAEAANVYATNIGDALSTVADETVRALSPEFTTRMIDAVVSHADDAVRRLHAA